LRPIWAAQGDPVSKKKKDGRKEGMEGGMRKKEREREGRKGGGREGRRKEGRTRQSWCLFFGFVMFT
jgi:hypothetical protein